MYPTLFTTPGLKRFAEDLDTERQAQLTKFGDQRHADGTGAEHYVAMADEAREDVERFVAQHSGPEWALILLEEVYEALAESDPAKLRTELIQTGAVIAAWIHDIDRRPPPAGVPFTAAELATAEADVAFLAEDDRPTGQKYPAAIGIYCDDCGRTFEGDFIVSDDMDQEQRFEAARAHLRGEGWSCTAAGDFCPACKPAEEQPS